MLTKFHDKVPEMRVRRTAALIFAGLLTACSGSDEMIEVQNYVQAVVNRPPGPIDPPPEFLSYVAFTYSAASLRGPFEIPLDAATALRNQQSDEVKPDENRPKEYLENFALGGLAMVGTISRDGQVWALVKDETLNINRVTLGNYLGKNHGRIVGITDTQISLMEIVPAGDGGWIERPQNIALSEI